MGGAAAKLEGFKDLEKDIKELKEGAANLEKVNAMIKGIQDKAMGKLKGFEDVKKGIEEKLGKATGDLKGLTDIQDGLTGKIGKLEGAIKSVAGGAMKSALGGLGGGLF